MKKAFVSAFIFLAMSTATFAQKSVLVPAAVKSSFGKDFPGINVKWEKEGANYEANFKKDGKTFSALYDAKGDKMETEQDIKIAELPKAVREYIAKNYKGEKIKEAAIITKANGEINYEAEIKGMDVLFTNDGKFIKTTKD